MNHAVLSRPVACLALAILILMGVPDGGRAQTSATMREAIMACTYAHPVRPVATLAELPEIVRDASIRQGITYGSFIRAGQSGAVYFIWYYSEGRADTAAIAIYRPASMAISALPEVWQRSTDTGSVCQLTDFLLGGR